MWSNLIYRENVEVNLLILKEEYVIEMKKKKKNRCKILVELVFKNFESYLKYTIPDSIRVTKMKIEILMFSRRLRI